MSEERVEVRLELADVVIKAPVLTSKRGSPSMSIRVMGCEATSVNNITKLHIVPYIWSRN